jgi:hypothetical protein
VSVFRLKSYATVLCWTAVEAESAQAAAEIVARREINSILPNPDKTVPLSEDWYLLHQTDTIVGGES